MFDNYLINDGPSHVTVTKTVNEHRAPTDKSVELLSQMEEKALSRLVHSVKLEVATFEVFAMLLRPRMEDGDYDLRYAFTLNGKPVDGRMRVTTREWYEAQAAGANTRRYLMQMIRKRAVEHLASEILAKFPVEY